MRPLFSNSKLTGPLRRAIQIVTIVVTILLCLTYWLFDDRHAWSEYLTIWPSFLWLFGLIPLALLGCSRPIERLCYVVFALIGIFMLSTIEWRSLLRFGGLAQPAGSLRLVTWNIAGASGGEPELLKRLAPLAPDLCLFQETPDRSDAFSAEQLTGTWTGYRWLDAGDCGLLSRFPVEVLPGERIGPWDLPQIVKLTPAQGAPIVIVNVRMMLPSLVLNPLSATNRRRLTEGHTQRLAQYPALAALITRTRAAHAGAEVILAGDFNTPGSAASLAPLREILGDVWPVVGRGWGGTITNSFPVSRIDQCWTTPGITPLAARVVEGAPSDHQMLVVDLQLAPDA